MSDAKNEARVLYNRAPNAKFYVNDFEVNSVLSGSPNAATKAWYTEMKKLTKKPVVFYSYRSFQQTYAPTAYKSYDAYWLAGYSS
ncbi:lysozyme, partial [Staphylococcus aureus]|nr:lysozyme [Staphylococcus aureus]